MCGVLSLISGIRDWMLSILRSGSGLLSKRLVPKYAQLRNLCFYVIFYLCVALYTHLLIDIFISNFLQMDFREALLEVYHGKMFPSWILDIDLELENTTRARFSMKDKVWLSLSVLFVHIPTLMVDVFPLIKSYRNLILFLFFSIMLTWPALMIW